MVFFFSWIWSLLLLLKMKRQMCSKNEMKSAQRKDKFFRKRSKLFWWFEETSNSTLCLKDYSTRVQFFHRRVTRKSRYQIPPHVTLNNLIPFDKTKYLKGGVSLVHCKGNDCIVLVFYFNGFYENYKRFLSKNKYFR